MLKYINYCIDFPFFLAKYQQMRSGSKSFEVLCNACLMLTFSLQAQLCQWLENVCMKLNHQHKFGSTDL